LGRAVEFFELLFVELPSSLPFLRNLKKGGGDIIVVLVYGWNIRGKVQTPQVFFFV
jgi:hypothetical protein